MRTTLSVLELDRVVPGERLTAGYSMMGKPSAVKWFIGNFAVPGFACSNEGWQVFARAPADQIGFSSQAEEV